MAKCKNEPRTFNGFVVRKPTGYVYADSFSLFKKNCIQRFVRNCLDMIEPPKDHAECQKIWRRHTDHGWEIIPCVLTTNTVDPNGTFSN